MGNKDNTPQGLKPISDLDKITGDDKHEIAAGLVQGMEPIKAAKEFVRLTKGLTAPQLIQEAMLWWESNGRDQMRYLRESDSNQYKNNIVTDDPTSDNYVPSQVLAGQPWKHLTKEDKYAVVTAYYSAL